MTDLKPGTRVLFTGFEDPDFNGVREIGVVHEGGSPQPSPAFVVRPMTIPSDGFAVYKVTGPDDHGVCWASRLNTEVAENLAYELNRKL